MNKFRIVVLFSILCLFIAIPAGFAMNNDTIIAAQDNNQHEISGDYYFDSGVENDSGNGSIDNPYKTLKVSRISKNANIHLANGEYWLDGVSYANNVNIMGTDPEKTIINFYGIGFNLNGPLTLTNVTLVNLGIRANSNTLTVTNTIFKDFSSSAYSVINSNNNVNIYNSTFTNNKGIAGSIYVDGGNLVIQDSLFEMNNAIRDGGAIFLKDSNLSATNLEIDNCSAEFGAAMTILHSEANIANITFKNNKAKYYGGAIYAMYHTVSLLNSNFVNNSAQRGGALFAVGVESLEAYNNKFINNYADYGEAIYSKFTDFYYDSYDDEKLNNTFTNNSVYVSNTIALLDVNNEYVLFNLNLSDSDELPSRYDLRELGLVTPAKNQKNGGNCWAFSALAALESAILKSTGISYDLSEENMKNIMAKFSEYGWSVETNDGGYDRMAVGYLTSWLGPILESEDEYHDDSFLAAQLDSFVHIQNILFLKRDNYTDNDAIKKAIMDYGAVSTCCYWSGSYLKGNSYYYNKDDGDLNHAVAIVGWDDNYSRDNFKTKPAGDGAWIFKNSHGLSGDNGFFYVSYYDTSFAMVNEYSSFAFVLNDTMKYDKIYQYDVAGKTDFFYNFTDTVWYKIKYDATDNEYLSAVSTYFDGVTSWDLSIYVNDVLKLTQSGVSPASYSTINLNEFIPLKGGDVFEIIFKIFSDGDAGVPISEPISLSFESFTDNTSHISYDGVNWIDFKDLSGTYPDHIYYSQVASIKAFTVLNNVNTSVLLEVSDSLNPAEITAHVFNQYGGAVNSGKVTFRLDGKNVDVDVVGGIAKIRYIFENRDTLVEATYNGVGYNSNCSSVIANANQVFFNVNDLVTYCGNGSFSLKVVDKDNNPISDRQVKFILQNNEYLVETDKDGIASIDFRISEVGDYSVKFGLFSDLNDIKFNSSNITVKSTIAFPDAGEFTYGSKYNVRLFDSYGNPLRNSDVELTFNSNTYGLSTDSNGVLSYDLYLKVGSYRISALNVETGEVKTQTIMLKNANVIVLLEVTDSFNPAEITAHVFNQNGAVVNSGTVTFKVDGKNFDVEVVGGIAKIRYIFENKDNLVEAVFNGVGYNSNHSAIHPDINQVFFKADDLTTYCGDNSFSITLVDKDNKPVSNKEIKFILQGSEYLVKTNGNGVASIDFRLSSVGNYLVRYALVNDLNDIKFNSSNIAVKSTILYPSAVKYTYGSKYVVKLFDSNGNLLANSDVKLTVNSNTYNLSTDSNGVLNYDINLNVGYHKISVLNVETGEVKTQSISAVARLNSNSNINMYFGAGNNYKVRAYDDNGNIAKNVAVVFKVGGKSYTRYTDKNGYAYLKIGLAPNTYIITATYKNFKVSNKIVVKPTLVMSTKTVKKSKTFKYTVKLLNNYGKILKYKKITVKFRGKTYYAKTNYKGIATFYVKALSKVGKFALIASYGNAKISKTITIKK